MMTMTVTYLLSTTLFPGFKGEKTVLSHYTGQLWYFWSSAFPSSILRWDEALSDAERHLAIQCMHTGQAWESLH